MTKPVITNTKSLAKTRLFHVEAVDLTFSNGEQRVYERLHRPHPGSVMVVPITAGDEFILIREYAVGIEGYELTFPKGFIDAGETPAVAANRELKEEVGFGANAVTHLREVCSSAAYMQSHMHILLARDLYSEKLLGDEPEELEIICWPCHNYRALLAEPEFISSASYAALFLAIEELDLA
jgi:ADP-ribose diphosphatase